LDRVAWTAAPEGSPIYHPLSMEAQPSTGLPVLSQRDIDGFSVKITLTHDDGSGMTRVDFYVLQSTTTADRLAYVCRLAEKASEREQLLHIYSSDCRLLARLDEQLWSYKADSFVPHRLLSTAGLTSTADDEPVLLSSAEPPPDRRVLLNLDAEVPPFFSRFERLLEVIDQSPVVREAGRERYRFYKHRGYPLQHHALR